MKKYFCIDLGGTKTIAALFNENGEQLFHVKFPTLSEKGVDFWFERLISLSKVCIEKNDIEMGCIASPGPLDIKSGKIVNIPTMGWKDVSIVKMLEEAFGFKFKLINDCSAGALGAWSVDKPNNMLYVSVSTGIGGGLILNSRLYDGNGNAAEIGHISVNGTGLKCACGRTDCLELYASGSGIQKLYKKETKKNLSAEELSILASKGDELAKTLFLNAGILINRVLKNVDTILDLDEIIIGGGLINSKELFWKNLSKDLPKCKVCPLKGDQVLIGAFIYIKEY